MTAIPIEEVQARLAQLIDQLAPGEVVIITRNNQVVAKLVGDRSAQTPRAPGNCKGMLTIVSEDDEHLQDWADYLP